MFKDIVSDFKEFRIWFLNWLFYRRHALKMKLAIRLADMKQKAFNKRYFIMLLELPSGDRLVSINNDEFKKLKLKKWLPKDMSYLDLEDQSFYQTPLSKNNTVNKKERIRAKEKYLKYAKKYMK